MGKSMNQMIIDINKAREIGVDMVEIRLDYLSSFNPRQDLQTLIQSCTMLTLFTYRPKWEGCEYEGDDSFRIATTVGDITNVARMFQIIVHSQVPFIGLVMTEQGLISWLLFPKYGGYLTFGSLEEGIVSAPGQPTVKDLLDTYNLRDIGPHTKVFGFIRKPVGHSKSLLLFNKEFKSVGFDGVYVPFLVDDLAKFLATYASAEFAGFSCTMPYKEASLECCDEFDPIAKLIGAVNTIVRRPSDGKLIGYNTDYIGAISAIEDGLRGVDGGFL
ncbi:hypothetical protein MKW98_016157, partial [Papaver atlanticum]